MRNAFWVSLFSMYGFTKMLPSGGSLLDFSVFFKNPSRSLGLFFYGGLISVFFTGAALLQEYPQFQNQKLNLRILENQRAHNLINILRFHLDTRRNSPMTGRT